MSAWDRIGEEIGERPWHTAEPEDRPADPLGEIFTVASMAGFELPDQEFLIDETVPVGAATTFFGNGGDGKTLCAMQMGVAVERGEPIFGFETKQAKVLGIFAEDPKEELDRRFRDTCRNAGIRQADVIGFEYQSRFGRESLLGTFAPTGEFVPSRLLIAIRERAVTTGARLVILDNIMHLYPGNVNDPGEVTRFLAALNRLALDINGAVLLIGHTSKTEGSTFMGTMAWSNASRSRLFIGRPGDLSDGDSVADIDPDARIFARLKANYAPISAPIAIRWHKGSFTRPDDLSPNVAAELSASIRATNENTRFLECLRERNRQGRAVSEKSGANYAPKIFSLMPEAKGLRKDKLVVAMDRLFRIGAIERGFLWRDTTEGRDIFGLRETSANASANDPQTRIADDRIPAENIREHTPIDTTYQSGAAHEAAAPFMEDDDPAVTAFLEGRPS